MKRIYAITCSGTPEQDILQPIPGMPALTLYILTCKKLSAVVRDISGPVQPLNKEMALDHARIIEALFGQTALLPVRFGTDLQSDDLIYRILAENHDRFLQNLLYITGKHEFGLKVYWDSKTYSEEPAANVQECKNTHSLLNHSPYSQYVFEKLKKQQLEGALRQKAEGLAEEISRYLSPLNPAEKYRKFLPHDLLLEANFLIDKDQEEHFGAKMNELAERHSQFQFLLTGPWPPYSFVEPGIPGHGGK